MWFTAVWQLATPKVLPAEWKSSSSQGACLRVSVSPDYAARAATFGSSVPSAAASIFATASRGVTSLNRLL